MPADFDRQTEDASCCRKICTASADRCTAYPLIFYEAWDDYCPPAALLFRFGPCGLFLVPEVEILSERSPISDGRGERRKFDTGPSRHPAKYVPGCVTELEKALGAVYQEWRGVIWRRQVWLICKESNKLKKIKFCFFMDCPRTAKRLVKESTGTWGDSLIAYKKLHPLGM